MRTHRCGPALVIGALLAVVPAFGCAGGEEAGRDAREAGEEAADKAREAGSEAAEKAREGLDKAGEKAGEVMQDLGPKAEAAKQTLEIKAALMAAEGLDASKIDVDTDPAARTVTLSGSVPTAAQKDTAERIARDKAEGYTVRSRLTVGAAAGRS